MCIGNVLVDRFYLEFALDRNLCKTVLDICLSQFYANLSRLLFLHLFRPTSDNARSPYFLVDSVPV
jgi:hypothetical protein